MLTRFNCTPNQFVYSVFLCAIAFTLLNPPVYAADTTNDGAMTVLRMEEMESLAGGQSYPGPRSFPGSSACSTGWSCPSPSVTT